MGGNNLPPLFQTKKRTKMENKVTISELPQLVSVLGTESIPVDSYDAVEEKNKTLRVSIEAIKAFVESGLDLGGAVTPEQILTWDAKETPLGAQDKADAGLVLAKEYTDEELVAVNLAISNLTDLLTSDDVVLDNLQEIVNFIKLNRSDLDTLSIASIAGLEDALDLKADAASVTSALADKADTLAMTSALADKADASALADKADASALADKADIKNNFEIVNADKTIDNSDAGKTLFITEDCTLTVSEYDSLYDGFNCAIIVDDIITAEVEFTGSDTVRGGYTEIGEDTTLIKSPKYGEFLFFGKARINDLPVGEEEAVYFDEVINNILTSGSLSIEALPNFIISPLGEDVSVSPPAIQSDSATEGRWYITMYGDEHDVTTMGVPLGDNGELLLTSEIVSVSFGFPFTYRVTDANSNMVQTQIYIYSELDTGDLEQIKLVDGPNILAAYTSTLVDSGRNFVFRDRPIITLDEDLVSLPESATTFKHIRGYTVADVEATPEATLALGFAAVTGSGDAGTLDYGTLGYYTNYYKFPLTGDRVLEDNGYFLHIVCEGLVLVSKPIQYFNSRHHPEAESDPEVADQYITDFCTHTVDFSNNYATLDQFTGDPNFIPYDDFNGQDTLESLESSVLFPYINKKISLVITTTENLIL